MSSMPNLEQQILVSYAVTITLSSPLDLRKHLRSPVIPLIFQQIADALHEQT